MSLFAKLSSGRPLASTMESVELSRGVWNVTLQRHDSGSHHAVLFGTCPLSTQQLIKGTICTVRCGLKSFLINVSSENVKPGQTQTLSVSAKLWEILGLPKDAKEAIIDESVQDHSAHALTELTISIKDRYVSKRDLWNFQIRQLGCVVYKSLSPPHDDLLRCSQSVAESLSTTNDAQAIFGVVGPQTKIMIRSNSAQICCIVNVSAELWRYDCVTREPVFKKIIQFLTAGLDLAIVGSKHHHLLLIVTGRLQTGAESVDVFEVVFDGPISGISVTRTKEQFSQFFNHFPTAVAWKDNLFFRENGVVPSTCPSWFRAVAGGVSEGVSLVRDTAACACAQAARDVGGIPTAANESNVLESIDLAIAHFGKHHLDRKLNVTGTQITLLTANTGSIRISSSELLEVSKKRIQATACGIRIVSVGPRPALTSPPVCILPTGPIAMDWLQFSYFTSQFPVALDQHLVLARAKHRADPDDPFAQRHSVVRHPDMFGSLEPKRKPVPEPLRLSPLLVKSDAHSLESALAMPRLQRVAVEANIRAGDVKPIDNWIVQGEGMKTLHDLIGTRLALDMQLVDISGSDPAATTLTPPSVTSGQPLSPISDRASSIISADAFGVKVHRSSMRETHIQKVLLRGGEDRCMWMLNRLDSGNVYVSRVSLLSQIDAVTTNPAELTYEYVLRRHSVSPLSEQVDTPNLPTGPRDVIVCKHCLSIDSSVSVERRRFGASPPLPWNVLDELISNPYIQQSLPSTVPYNAAPLPPELEGFRWKLRSSIRTGLFCLLPTDASYSNTCSPAATLGQDVQVSCTQGGIVASRFLDWLRKAEQILKIPSLNVSVIAEKQKRVSGFSPAWIKVSPTDWFQFQSEKQFQFPRPFIFSIEWILCHSVFVEDIVAALTAAAKEDQFALIRLPHAQLFPLPLPTGDTDELPFHGRKSIQLPEWTSPSFFGLLLARLMDQLRMILLFSTKEATAPEGFYVNRRPYFSRQPGWILMTKDGMVLVEISASKIDWITNSTLSWSSSRTGTNQWETEQTLFVMLKQAIHTSLIDSSQS